MTSVTTGLQLGQAVDVSNGGVRIGLFSLILYHRHPLLISLKGALSLDTVPRLSLHYTRL
jgi:hypothetical protein